MVGLISPAALAFVRGDSEAFVEDDGLLLELETIPRRLESSSTTGLPSRLPMLSFAPLFIPPTGLSFSIDLAHDRLAAGLGEPSLRH
jgi:hypothetical protein